MDTPLVYFCYFFPASFGLLIAYNGRISHLSYLIIFIIGSILTRAAGCIINDLIDRNLDKKVARTKDRPIASGAISINTAMILLITLLMLGFLLLMLFNIMSIMVGMLAVVMMSLYPLMKRITFFPQVFLGLTLNLSCLIGYAAITDDISADAMVMFVACGFWTVAYDTIYAFMDLEDDKKIGIKSTARFFEYRNYKLVLFLCYLTFLLLFAFSVRQSLGYTLLITIALVFIFILWIVYTLDITNKQNCLTRFEINNYIGMMLFFGLLLEKL